LRSGSQLASIAADLFGCATDATAENRKSYSPAPAVVASFETLANSGFVTLKSQ